MKKGWQVKKLEDVCEIERGGSPRPIQNFITTEPDGINWIKIGDATASGKYIYETEEKIKPAGVKRSRMVYVDDFILSNSMSFGRPYIMKTSGCIHDGWLVLRQREKQVEQDFLYYVLSSDLVFQQFDRLAAGSTVRNLNIGLVKGVTIPFPPLAEQRRIVAVLDEAFEGIATAKANAERNLLNAKAIFESHLQSVFSRRGPGWVETTLNSVYEVGSSKRVLKSEWKASGVPFYRGREITRLSADGFVDNELFITEEYFEELSRRSGVPKAGDIVITAIGTIGNAHIVRESDRFYFKDASVLWMKRHSDVSSDFIRYWLKSPSFFGQLDRGHGATVDTLTIQKLQSVRILLPDLIAQKQIAAQLDAISAETRRLASLYERKLAALEALKKSLLHRAFSGVL